jgi:predicted small lipoprotein YifL
VRYIALLHILILILLLVAAACGRKGDPRPPEKITVNIPSLDGRG